MVLFYHIILYLSTPSSNKLKFDIGLSHFRS